MKTALQPLLVIEREAFVEKKRQPLRRLLLHEGGYGEAEGEIDLIHGSERELLQLQHALPASEEELQAVIDEEGAVASAGNLGEHASRLLIEMPAEALRNPEGELGNALSCQREGVEMPLYPLIFPDGGEKTELPRSKLRETLQLSLKLSLELMLP